jgi:endo-1,4-beta-xylanase
MPAITARDRLRLLAGAASSFALAACGGGGGGGSSSAVGIDTGSPGGGTTPTPTPTGPVFTPTAPDLKTNFRNNFLVGAAVRPQTQVDNPAAVDLLLKHYNSITPENDLKMGAIAPTEGVFNFDTMDALVDFAEENGMEIEGHTLLWHVETPDYFLQGTPAQIRTRLENYITTVVSRYAGRIKTWHVVNEVVANNPDEPTGVSGQQGLYRNSNWYQAVGNADFIDWAFNAARAADPNAILLFNEFNTEIPLKRRALVAILEDLLSRGIPVDGVGHQFHATLQTPVSEILAALDAVDDMFAGLVNHVTELDISMYTDPGSCFETQTNCQPDVGGPSIPAAQDRVQAQMYKDLFAGFVQRSTGSLNAVTTWGYYDGLSFLNNSPVTRFNHPLLFDRDLQEKTAYRAIMDPNYQF